MLVCGCVSKEKKIFEKCLKSTRQLTGHLVQLMKTGFNLMVVLILVYIVHHYKLTLYLQLGRRLYVICVQSIIAIMTVVALP